MTNKLPYINFEKPTKEQWIKKIQKELKLPEPSLTPLIKNLEKDLTIEPIYTNKDAENITPTSIPNKKINKTLYFPEHFGLKILDKISKLSEVNDYIFDLRFQKKDKLQINYNGKTLIDGISTKIFLGNTIENIDIFFADYLAEAGLTSAQQLAITIFVIKNYNINKILWTTNDNFITSVAKIFAFYKYKIETELWLRNELNSYTRKLPHTNLVRGAIAIFSAVLLKPSVLFCLPYNIHGVNSEEEIFHSTRWAINTLHILDYESKIFDLENPISGAYTIEILADKIYQKSKQYLSELNKNNFYSKVAEWLITAQTEIKKLQKVKIGANKFQVENENIPETFVKFYSSKYDLIPYGILAENIILS